MRIKFLQLTVLAVVQMLHASVTAAAVMPGAASVFPAHRGYESSDGTKNYVSFSVDVPNAGLYHIGFWLLPTGLDNGEYSPFEVTVNGTPAGMVSPQKGNWQSITVDDNPPVYLERGVNTVEIAAPCPDIPEVETAVVSKFREQANIAGSLYAEYLSESKKGVCAEQPMEYSASVGDMSDAESPETFVCDLRYSFFKKIEYVKDQEVVISTNSEKQHSVDIVFIGNYTTDMPIDSIPRLYGTTNDISGDIQPGIERKYFRRASSEEMQGLTYTYRSVKAINADEQIVSKITSIPKDGVYLIRVRTQDNSTQGVVDVNINGRYYYQDMPISLSYVGCVMPRYENEYATMTRCYSDTDRPALFVHGVGDKVVGYSSTSSYFMQRKYGLSSNDAYISQVYRYNTRGVSVISASSSRPVSRCDIITRVAVNNPGAQSDADYKKTDAGMPDCGARTINRAAGGIKMPGSVDVSSAIQIESESEILNVAVYDLCGRRLQVADINGRMDNRRLTDYNIKKRGVYVFMIHTRAGTVVRKISVR